MSDQEIPYQDIDRYLQGEFRETEREAFEQRMKKDAALAQQVAWYRKVMEAAVDDDTDLFKQKVINVFDEPDAAIEKSGHKRTLNSGKKYLLAASLLLLVALSYFMYHNYSGKPTPEVLFTQHFDVHSFHLRSSDTASGKELAQAQAYYQQKDYRSALEVLDEMAGSQSPMVHFYRGNCYLQLGGTTQALQAFQKVIDDGDNLFIFEAQWYSALAYLKKGKAKKTRDILQALLTDPGLTKEEEKRISTLLKKL